MSHQGVHDCLVGRLQEGVTNTQIYDIQALSFLPTSIFFSNNNLLKQLLIVIQNHTTSFTFITNSGHTPEDGTLGISAYERAGELRRAHGQDLSLRHGRYAKERPRWRRDVPHRYGYVTQGKTLQ